MVGQATIHPPNAIEWPAGDYFIHDADAKRADMLMVMLGRSASGIYRTRDAYPAEQPRSRRHSGRPARLDPAIVAEAGRLPLPKPAPWACPLGGPTARSDSRALAS